MKKTVSAAIFVLICAVAFYFTFKLQPLVLRSEIDKIQREITELNSRIDAIEYLIDSISGIDLNTAQFDLDWLCLKLAIIKVESNFNPRAVNRTNGDGGLYQHLPLALNGYTREANRLQDSIVFTDDCRFDPLRATQIFEIVNSHYNPDRCIEIAIKRHNPGGGEWYRERVLREYEFFKQIIK